MIYDAIIIGSGPAAVWAAKGLIGKSTLIVDLGKSVETTRHLPGLSEVRKKPEVYTDILLGPGYESLRSIFEPYLSPKIKAPLLGFSAERKYITQKSGRGFDYIYSEAKGGLTNNWGAGAYPFSEKELGRFPFSPREILEIYEELSREFGISGENDDLNLIYGSNLKLQPGLKLPLVLNEILKEYQKKRTSLRSRDFLLGHGRMAIDTRIYDHSFMEYFASGNPAVYNSKHTLDQLISANLVAYRQNLRALKFEEKDFIELECLNEVTKKVESYRSRTLILSAGAIGTAGIVAQSFELFGHKFPIMDNAAVMFPMFMPRLIGTPTANGENIGGILNGAHGSQQIEDLHFSVYGMGQILASDLISQFPLPMKINRKFSRYFANAMAVLQIFYPDQIKSENWIQYSPNGKISVQYANPPVNQVGERAILKSFRRIGLLTHSLLAKRPGPGNGIHYAGMLPMAEAGQDFLSCEPSGRLRGTKSIYVADGSSFPSLPAKNYTLTIMANALRVGRKVRESL